MEMNSSEYIKPIKPILLEYLETKTYCQANINLTSS